MSSVGWSNFTQSARADLRFRLGGFNNFSALNFADLYLLYGTSEGIQYYTQNSYFSSTYETTASSTPESLPNKTAVREPLGISLNEL